MSDVNTKLDFVMQQQAETMKALKSMDNRITSSISSPLWLTSNQCQQRNQPSIYYELGLIEEAINI
jgi:hypothetical protein